MAFLNSVHDKRVLVTGHTGFKGAWIVEWLLAHGARVAGLALPPDWANSMHEELSHPDRIDHYLGDIRDPKRVGEVIEHVDPELVFHLAAQPLVLRSYREPVLTWETNVIGTLNVLEAIRKLGHRVDVVVVTTDKVYRNKEWRYSYRENDELGGHDPYSASKAACELAVASWSASYAEESGIRVATARAGNVIGGGDWNVARLVPDCFRAWSRGEVVKLRSPLATRPWQHVLEPLSGYLAMADALSRDWGTPSCEPSCNFGPLPGATRTVADLVARLSGNHPSRQWRTSGQEHPHEAHHLSLAIDLAMERLGWSPRLSFDESVAWTDASYSVNNRGLSALISEQLASYEALLTTPMNLSDPLPR